MTGKAAVVDTNTKPKATICGSQSGDKITAKGGAAYIETFGGVDFVNAQNGKPDEVWNGSGSDDGLYDSCDRVYDLDKGKKSTAKCPGVASKSGLRSLQAREFPFELPQVDCDAKGGAFLFKNLPRMRAIDATDEVDWQYVGWSAGLYQRMPRGWILRGQTEWVWDRVYDEQVRTFPGNEWRSFVKGRRAIFALKRRNPGMFRIAIHFKWYGGQGVPDREHRVWAGRLVQALRNQGGC